MRTDITIGTLVRIEATERAELSRMTDEMYELVKLQSPGWLTRYMRLHKRAGDLIRHCIDRSWSHEK